MHALPATSDGQWLSLADAVTHSFREATAGGRSRRTTTDSAESRRPAMPSWKITSCDKKLKSSSHYEIFLTLHDRVHSTSLLQSVQMVREALGVGANDRWRRAA